MKNLAAQAQGSQAQTHKEIASAPTHWTFKAVVWIVALVALATVFLLYLRPDFLVQLSNQLWACF